MPSGNFRQSLKGGEVGEGVLSIMDAEFSEACSKKFNEKVAKGRSSTPWTYSFLELFDRLQEEEVELWYAIDEKAPDEIIDECLDVANFAWFIYQKAKEMMK